MATIKEMATRGVEVVLDRAIEKETYEKAQPLTKMTNNGCYYYYYFYLFLFFLL